MMLSHGQPAGPSQSDSRTGLARSPSTNMLGLNGSPNMNGGGVHASGGLGASSTIQSTRCDLPTAVHIAQISSSDEDYLDFG